MTSHPMTHPNDTPQAKAMVAHLFSIVGTPLPPLHCLTCKGEFAFDENIHEGGDYCPKCRSAAVMAEKHRAQAEARDRRIKAWLQTIPPIFHEHDMNRVPPASQAAVQKILGWQMGPRGMVASGVSRAGKSRAFYALLKRLVGDGVQVMVFDSVSFGHQCGKAFLNGVGEEWAEEIAEAELVYFDDLFKLKLTERAESELFGVIDRRANWGRPILASGNFTAEMVKQRMSVDRGEALVERLKEFNDIVMFPRMGSDSPAK